MFDVDVLIVGSGFAGSLLATILQNSGLTTALVDRAKHPRFAIGESSTPTANFILNDLARTYELDWLQPFCKYGTWKSAHPEVRCGLKRGFSYFKHSADKEFKPEFNHLNELLVAASGSDATGDTQWMRSDIDHFFFQRAQLAGVVCREECVITSLGVNDPGSKWQVELVSASVHGSGVARFIVDASGSNDVLVRFLNLQNERDELTTNSRAIFGHFSNLPKWEDVITAPQTSATESASTCRIEYPFACDDAALHHILDEGWMWWIRFDSGITSVGLVLDAARRPDAGDAAEVEWNSVLSRYPTLARVLTTATCPHLIKTRRLQRQVGQIVGPNWALIPHTAGFVDPLHSTGIACSLAGISRLSNCLLKQWNRPELSLELHRYEASVKSELRLIDILVSGCYRAISHQSFRAFTAFSMAYFAAATSWERQHVLASDGHLPPLFLADSSAFLDSIDQLHGRLVSLGAEFSDVEFESLCKRHLEPFNYVGLFDPSCQNMYGKTAVPE